MSDNENDDLIRATIDLARVVGASRGVFIERDGVPIGVTDIGTVGVPAFILALRAAAHATSSEALTREVSEALAQLDAEHDTAEVVHILFGSVVVLARSYLAPAYERLDAAGDDLGDATSRQWAMLRRALAEDDPTQTS
jgi:hypothetical protein